MVKWFISLLAVATLVNAGYSGIQQAAEAPVLPKNASPLYQAQQSYVPQPAPQVALPPPQQQPPARQPQAYAPAPQQQQPAPQPQPQTYAPAPQQQQPAPAPQPQAYAPAPQQQQPAPQPQTYSPAPQPQQPYNQPQQTPPRPLFDCKSKSDGLYELGRCQSKYIQCLYGEASFATCPANLVFDNDRCNYKNDCLNPTQPPPPQQQPPAPIPQAYAPQPQSYGPAPQQQQPAPQPQTYAPAPQQQQPAPQPQPQAYAPASQEQAPVSGYARQQQFNAYGKPPVQQAPPKPAETYCQQNNLIEGYHAPGCSSDYFACYPLTTLRLSCPPGLFYDTELNQCDYKNLIKNCGGTRPQPTAQSPPLNPYGPAPTLQQQPQVYAPAPQPQTHAPAPQQQQPAPQPQPQTYAPAPQQQQPAPQPQPQTYAPAPQQQQPAPQPQPQAYAPAPQQQQPAPQPQTYAPAPQSQQQPYASVQQTPPKPVDTFCSDRSLSDGFYGKGCSPRFYVCALGQTTRLDCPHGLFYDKDTNECGHKNTIVSCGGQKPTQPPAQQPPQTAPYGQAAARQPPPPPEFDCSSRTDGIYIRGCTSKYFVCLQGTTMPLSCPTGTFYSAYTEMCDFKQNVVECGGKAPTKQPIAQNPVMIPQSPYGRRPEQPAQQPPVAPQVSYGQKQAPAQQPPTPSNNPCATLSNGIYGRKCSRFFFVCATQKTYDFICPKDHAFNLKSVKCAPKTEISTCSEYAPAPQQQQPAPQPQPQIYAPAPQQPAPQPQRYAPAPQQQSPAPQPQPQTYAPASQQQQPEILQGGPSQYL
jgi:hypothetical protein